MKSEILDLLKSGKAEDALLAMSDHNNNAKLILADYRNEKKLFEAGLSPEKNFESYHQKILIRIANLHSEPDEIVVAEKSDVKASIFLSYNHKDFLNAIDIVKRFKPYGIDVRIDQTHVYAGESIKDFIINQTTDTNAVMILVSKNSLRSPWVLHETTMAMFNELLSNKRVIPVSLDNSYEDDGFIYETIKILGTELSVKEVSAKKINDEGIIASFIYNDIVKLADARNQIPKIIEKLRAVAVYSTIEAELEKSIEKIAFMLTSQIKN